MIRNDFHTHTTWCDGKNTAEDMVLAAIGKGMEVIGFSGHGLTPGDESYCMSEEGTRGYIEEISRLKDIYGKSITIYCGVEWDYYSSGDRTGFEYTIGSVHYLKKGGSLNPVDESPQVFARIVKESFGGDYLAAAEEFFSLEGDVLERTGADIIGHFDLITKFNETDRLFDSHDPRYISAWQQAADKLLRYGVPFEINTGAITRGYRTLPYPSVEIIDYIGSHGGSFILSSDSHSVSSLLYGFDEWESFINDRGFTLLRYPACLI